MNAESDRPDWKRKSTDTTAAATVRSITMAENRIDSGDLFSSGREIAITHGTEVYRLRLTSQNKLILTK